MGGEGGVWRTVSGRRVFIREGQSLSNAMKESGKFGQSKSEKWDYRGYQKRVQKLKDQLSKVKTHKQATELHRAMEDSDKNLTAEIERAEGGDKESGDVRELYSLRRQVRLLKRQLNQKQIM